MRVLIVNAGSTGLKLAVVEGGEAIASSQSGPADEDGDGLADAIAELSGFDAVGHRIVHGGDRYTGPTVIDAAVRAGIEDLAELAPLHQGPALAGIDAVSERHPDVPAVACFDTAFHADLPVAASTYALPREWRERWPVRRYGFHGLSVAYAARRAASMIGRDGLALRTVVCHLGGGASVTACLGGASVDTTMGFTPLEGLVMATRSGTIDPGLALWLAQRDGLDAAAVQDALGHRSGLLGLAGTADMREVLERASAGDEDAVLARDVHVHRLRAAIAAMAAATNGLDALVFTGGIGEASAEIRRRTVDGLAFLGLRIGTDDADGDAEITDARGGPNRARVLVVHAREDLEIARQTLSVVGSRDDPAVGGRTA